MRVLLTIAIFVVAAAQNTGANDHMVVFDDRLEEVMSPKAEITVLARGFTWAEGPVWDERRHRLYFSDVPANKAYSWSPDTGLSVFLTPSGLLTGDTAGFREPGSNGLLVTREGTLLIANHGRRRVEELFLDTGIRHPVATHYNGQPLNSPNDIALSANGIIYFTDPPYGLAGIHASPLKKQPQNGVYRVRRGEEPVLIDGTLSLPNGIALSPNDETLYVSVSDPDAPHIYRYDLSGDTVQRTLFFDASPFLEKGWPGLPDGMAITRTGHIFATGPGGIFILTPDGVALGIIKFDRPTANCAFGLDGQTLFITSQDRLLSVKTRVRGAVRHD